MLRARALASIAPGIGGGRIVRGRRFAVWWARAALLAVVALVVVYPRIALAQVSPLPGHDYKEVVNPKRPVSGRAVVGASLQSGTIESPATLYVWSPADYADVQVRVDIESADGRFLGSGLYGGKLVKGRQSITLLPSSSHSVLPQGIDRRDLAVSVVMTQGHQPPRQLLASWTPQDPEVGTLLLRVNGGRAEILTRGRAGLEQPCKRVPSASIVRFNFTCEVRVADLERRPGADSVVRLLRRDGFDTEPIEYRIAYR